MDSEDDVPNPNIPEHTMIAEGVDAFSHPVRLAIGICVCNDFRELSKEFRLQPGGQWTCPDCGRVYSFHGDQIDADPPVTD